MAITKAVRLETADRGEDAVVSSVSNSCMIARPDLSLFARGASGLFASVASFSLTVKFNDGLLHGSVAGRLFC